MMKGIYLYMTMCVAAIAFTACTNELEESTMPTDALVLTVGGFPAFQETPETRAALSTQARPNGRMGTRYWSA